MQSSVAHQKEQEPGDETGADLRPGGLLPFRQSPDEKRRARDQMAQARGVERRNRPDGVPDGEIRRTPDNVDGQKRQHHGGTAGRRAGDGKVIHSAGGMLRPGKNRGFWRSTHLAFSLWRVTSLVLYTHYQRRPCPVTSQPYLSHYHGTEPRPISRPRPRQDRSLGGPCQQRGMGHLRLAQGLARRPILATVFSRAVAVRGVGRQAFSRPKIPRAPQRLADGRGG